jgi:hypothetical protein
MSQAKFFQKRSLTGGEEGDYTNTTGDAVRGASMTVL